MVLFDQRGSGRSTPHASDPRVSLETNTTPHLVADMERLRVALDVDRWVLCGSSWGTTLALAYALAHPQRVLGMILRSITTYSPGEMTWFYRDGANHLLPERWDELLTALPEDGAGRRRRLVPRASRVARRRGPDTGRAGVVPVGDRGPALHARPGRRGDLRRPEVRGGVRPHQRALRPAPRLPGGRAVARPRAVSWPAYPACSSRDGSTPARPPVTAWRLHRAWPGSRLRLLDDESHRLTGAAAILADEARRMAELVAAT